MKKSRTIRKRIISFALTAAVVLSCFLCDAGTLRSKAEENVYGAANVTQDNGNNLVMVEGAGGLEAHCNLVMKEGKPTLVYPAAVNADVDEELDVSGCTLILESDTILNVYSTASILEVNAGCEVLFHGDCTTTLDLDASASATVADGILRTGSHIITNSGSNFTVASDASLVGITSGDSFGGITTNNGTINGTFSYSGTGETSATLFTNNGIIKGSSCTISGNFVDSSTAEYLVTSSFTKGDMNLNGTVIPSNENKFDNEDVVINSTGGTTKVELEEVTITKTTAFNGKAGDFVPKADIGVSADWPSKLYYGIEYNYASYITCDSTGTRTVQFADDTGTIGSDFGDKYTENPKKEGYHQMYVDVAATSTCRANSFVSQFKIDYLARPGYCTIDQTPVKDDGSCEFYNQPITLRAPDGYKVSQDNGKTEPHATTTTVSNDGYYQGIMGNFQASNGAQTQLGDYIYLKDVVIDQTAPIIKQNTAFDQDDAPIKTTIKDGVTLNARSVYFDVHDSNGNGNALASVTVDGESIPVLSDLGTAHVVLKQYLPGKKTHKIVATDECDNTSVWNITLNYLPTPTPETPYKVSGTEGKNGFYTGEVKLIPTDGYLISDNVNGSFASGITYKPGMEYVWLMKESNEAFTDAIKVAPIKIDKEDPTFARFATDINGKTIALNDGGVYTSRKLAFTVTDENLESVTVNGNPMPVKDGKADVTLATIAQRKEFTVVATDLAGRSTTRTFTIDHKRKAAQAKIVIENYYYGMVPKAEISSNSDMVSRAEVYYKSADSGDENFSTAYPLSVGNYVAKVIVPMSDDYNSAEDRTEFNVSYLPTPATPYTLGGTEGKNGYYKSDVELVAPEGYKIASSVSEEGSSRVAYTEGMNGFYLRRTDDGATTAFIPITETIKIDKEIPVLAGTARDQDGQSVGIVHGMTYLADTMTFTITDDHLVSLTINGSKTAVTGGKAVVSLDAEQGIKDFVIAAEDEAGNVYNVTITLMATWYKDKIIPMGAPVPLSAGELYNLGGGIWRVNGGQTLYPGGGSFCVVIPGDYTFVTTE